MLNSWISFTKIFVLINLILITACSGPQLKLEPIPATANPTEEAGKFETEIANARQQQVNLLAPSWFKKAESSLLTAKNHISQEAPVDMITTSISKGRAELAKALETANITRVAIPEAIKGRELARVAGATSLGQKYTDAEALFLNLTREIEDNNLSYAQRNEKKVVAAFRDIEIQAIKENTLGDVRKLLAQAQREEAKSIAPEHFAYAQQQLQDVDAFISTNPYAKEEMYQKAATALFEANRVLHIIRQTERFRKMPPLEITLWAEDIIQKTSAALGAPDMRDQPLTVQTANILGTANALKIDRDFLAEKSYSQQAEMNALRIKQQDELTALRAKLATEVGQKKEVEAAKRAEQERLAAEKYAVEYKLISERKFNEQYNRVQALFSSEEAECYKQGQQMVVRLRAMSFPIGQSIIMPENYALLSKVQRAIRTFENPAITIEGHTDSTGGLELNNHLSQMRAEAVREYFLANGVGSAESIAAIGYGPSRPLAPNTTTKGRAQNRRIDLIITPRLAAQ